MSVGSALQGVLMLLSLIGAGFYMARRRFLTEELEGALATLALRFSIPALLFVSTADYITPAFLAEAGSFLLIPFGCMLAGFGLGLLLARLFPVPRRGRGVFLVMFALSNSIFIGLPVCLAIFGEEAMPYVVSYFPANTLFFWTLGNLGIAADGGKKPKGLSDVLKQIFSPPFLGFLAGLAAALTGLALPPFIPQALSYLGGLTVPISLLTTGAMLSRMGRDALRLPVAGCLTLLGRFLLIPGLTLGVCLLFGAPPLMTGVFTMTAAMPVMSQCVIMARVHGADGRLASQMLTVSTLLSLAFIPLWVLLLERIL